MIESHEFKIIMIKNPIKVKSLIVFIIAVV